MTICFVSDSYPLSRPFGGMAVYTQTAAQALCQRGHAVHVVVGCRGESRDLTDGSVQVHYRSVSWLPVVGSFAPALGESLGIAKALRRLHRDFRFDIVEFPNFEGLGLVTEVFRTIPTVVRLHTSMVESVEVQGRPPTAGERFMMWAEKQSARMAHGVVTHSLAHRDRLASTYGLSDIAVIPHGIRLPAPRSEEPLEPMVLTLGRLSARKGGKTLLAAIPRIHADAPDARFVLVGAGEDHPLVVQFRKDHPQIPREKTAFHEFIDGAELERLYASASVYASASIYESFGLTFVEAMARSMPVVGCATSAMNEIIAPEETGLLVPPNDPEAFSRAVIRLLQDAPLRRRMGAAARRTVEERYTAGRMAEEIESWYLKALGRSPVASVPAR